MGKLSRRKLTLLFGLVLIVLVSVAFIVLKRRANNFVQEVPVTETIQTQDSQPVSDEPDKEPEFELVDLQPVIDKWAKRQTGKASVVVYDLNNNQTVASYKPDEQYFTASIYKLYVAYMGYQKVADGTYSMSEPYLGSYNRGKCLDEMIRSSYSPCGEKMWAELGKQNITDKMKEYGLQNTSLTGLYTSAADAALILERLFDKTDLSQEHVDLFMDSLEDQPDKYRVGLPSGFTSATVYNKVGWNEDLEWHDTAIVTFKDGHSYVVSVMTRSVGRANVVKLAQAIQAKVEE